MDHDRLVLSILQRKFIKNIIGYYNEHLFWTDSTHPGLRKILSLMFVVVKDQRRSFWFLE